DESLGVGFVGHEIRREPAGAASLGRRRADHCERLAGERSPVASAREQGVEERLDPVATRQDDAIDLVQTRDGGAELGGIERWFDLQAWQQERVGAGLEEPLDERGRGLYRPRDDDAPAEQRTGVETPEPLAQAQHA